MTKYHKSGDKIELIINMIDVMITTLPCVLNNKNDDVL